MPAEAARKRSVRPSTSGRAASWRGIRLTIDLAGLAIAGGLFIGISFSLLAVALTLVAVAAIVLFAMAMPARRRRPGPRARRPAPRAGAFRR